MINRFLNWLERRIAIWSEYEDEASLRHMRKKADEDAANRIEDEARNDH